MKTTLVIILTLIFCDLFSQSIVKGVVTDSLGNEIYGVHIVELETTNGTITDLNGRFELTTLKDSTQISVGFIGSAGKRIFIQSDTTLNISLQEPEIEYFDFYKTKWLTIGTKYDFFNSTFGLKISNGYDERPLIHFEDFSEDFVFKLQGNTDFNKDYSYGVNVGWKFPTYLSLIAIGFYDYNYTTRDFQFQDLNISAETFIKNTDFVVKLKLAYQNLNSDRNVGVELGLSNVIIYRKLYVGLSSGYYFDYFTYSGFIQSFVYKNIIGIKLNYERIDNYDFLNLGMSVTFKR